MNNTIAIAFIFFTLLALIFIFPTMFLSSKINKLLKKAYTIKNFDNLSNLRQTIIISSISNLALLIIFRKAIFFYPFYLLLFLFSIFLEENWKEFKATKRIKYLLSCFAFTIISILISATIFMFFNIPRID